MLVKSDANGWSSQCNYPVFSVSLRSAPGRAFVLRIEPGQKTGLSPPFGLQSLVRGSGLVSIKNDRQAEDLPFLMHETARSAAGS